MLGHGWRRLVLKVGSALIAPERKGCSTRYLLTLARFISECRSRGIEVVLVSSGSVAAGRSAIAFSHQPLPIPVKQAMASVGQYQMMQLWQNLLDCHCGQLLLTHDDFHNRRRYLNIENTLRTLLDHQVLPIINENDSVATAELKLGDNDNLAALVATAVDADVLIICSDIDGLYSANPRSNPQAQFIAEVERITPEIFAMAGGSHHNVGTGGMVTKLQAAQKAAQQGIDTLIVNGQKAAVFETLLEGKAAGTLFHRQQERLSAKKHWLLHGLKSQGQIQLDPGAVKALQQQGASLLAKGVSAVSGQFDKGDAVLLCDSSGSPFAKGICQYPASELSRIKGLHSQHIAATLGYCPREEVIHRDDLVLLSAAEAAAQSSS
ncbi:glutamate 5-kinase [Alkalimonas amylolytica]|uniref:Glutamate 5-kinase n=1 Tax=Alkalimonas amylolytica TaxID=152573 RepID=A0A1H4D850_ALKAM|nr:glutamate 5-kinase [Alkalimonas amylolytica]SEA68871.1 glutamate 5-kinase [Alkalimonas amylolytica]